MKMISKYITIILCLSLSLSLCACGDSEEKKAYKSATALLEAGEYEKAERAFAALGDYEDSRKMVSETKYQAAKAMLDAGDYDSAEKAFKALGDYRDSAYMIEDVQNARTFSTAYESAQDLLDAGKFDEAIAAFSALGNYNNSEKKVEEAVEAKNVTFYSKAKDLLAQGKYTDAFKLFFAIKDYKDVSSILDKFEPILISQTTILLLGDTLTIEYEYSYDEEGRLKQMTWKDSTWDNTKPGPTTTSYFYNNEGWLERTIQYTNHSMFSVETHYNRDGNKTVEYEYEWDEPFSTEQFEYEIVDGMVRKQTSYYYNYKYSGSDSSFFRDEKRVIVYDEHGNVSDITCYSLDNDQQLENEHRINTYDDEGRLIKVLNPSGYTYYYTYDEYGNLIEADEGYNTSYQYEYRYTGD